MSIETLIATLKNFTSPEWIAARVKEVTTKWGFAGVVILGLLFLQSETMGDWTQRISAMTGLAMSIRMILHEETPPETTKDGAL